MPTDDKKKPSILRVLLASYLGFPGAGHLMIGCKRLGFAYIAVFSLGVAGILYQILALVPLLQQVAFDVTNGDLDSLAAFQNQILSLESTSLHSGLIFWSGLLATLAWAISGAHAAYILQKSAPPLEKIKEPPSVGGTENGS